MVHRPLGLDSNAVRLLCWCRVHGDSVHFIFWKMWPLILLGLLASTTCLPLEEKETQPTTDSIEQLQKTVNVVSYIQNFKNAMAEYVKNQYPNLTEHNMEQIKQILEEFLVTFANDLRETVEAQNNNVTFEKEREKIQDGVPDATFVEIRERILTELPDIKEDTADVIVFKLRRNLYVTRQKIDYIIRSSEKQFEYAIA